MTAVARRAITERPEIQTYPLMTARDISVVYGDQTVLDVPGLINIENGEITALVGASGSGKSSLLGVLFGLAKPTTGEVIHYDKFGDVTYTNKADLRPPIQKFITNIYRWIVLELPEERHAAKHRSNSGYAAQRAFLDPHLTAEEHIDYTHRVRGNKLNPERINSLLGSLNINTLLDHKPSELSGGEEQRAAIAFALAHMPIAAIMDEPTSALDTKNSIATMEIFRKQTDQHGTPFIIVSHDPAIEEYADKVFRFEDGRIVSQT